MALFDDKKGGASLREKYNHAVQTAKSLRMDGAADERDGKLYVNGTVNSEDEKNQIWNAIKFGSVLLSKLNKRYWELPHVKGMPLIFAVQDFHTIRAMSWSNTSLVEYLYGIRQVRKK